MLPSPGASGSVNNRGMNILGEVKGGELKWAPWERERERERRDREKRDLQN